MGSARGRADGLLERALRHDRILVVAGMLAVVVLSWAYLLAGAGTMQEMDGMLMPMSSGPWTLDHVLTMLLMWAVMMAAMMLPSAAPMILLYATIARGRGASSMQATSSGIFAAGYVTTWSAFSLGAVALQYVLERFALLSPMMETTSKTLAGGILIVAGIYQWSPLKKTCLQGCRSPLDFVLTHWRPGARGAFVMGLQHGMYCVGCCWMLMLLLFVGGIMNLGWIAGLAILVLVEKLAPAGHWIGRGAGILLAGWGIAALLHAASVAPGMLSHP
jgi:predicted metal-binding membrane protein